MPSPRRLDAALRHQHLRYPHHKLVLLFNTLHIFLIVSCAASVSVRCYMAFGSKFSPWYYLTNSPALWIVQWHTITFHTALIVVEMNVGVPCLLPKTTLENFAQRECLISFLGLLEWSLGARRSVVDIVNAVLEDVRSKRRP